METETTEEQTHEGTINLSGTSITSIADEVTVLETQLGSLNLNNEEGVTEGAGVPSGVNLALIQNDIRTSLKSIEEFIQSNPEKTSAKVCSRIHKILKEPLKPDRISPSNGNDVGSIISYLKLLAEVSSPTLQQSDSNSSGTKQIDVFWGRILEPIAVDIFAYLNDQVFRKCFAILSSSSTIKNSGIMGVAEMSSNQGSGYAFHHQLGILLKGVRILLVYLKRGIQNLPKEEGGEDNGDLKNSVTEILTVLSSLMDPLKAANNRTDFDIGLDIRCNIGIGICYSMYYLRYPDDGHIQAFFRAIFNPLLQPTSSYWSVNEQQILEMATSDKNRIALAFGILNTWLEQEHDQNLYFSIAENVLNIEHGVKEAVNLGSSRVLEIWADKLARPCVPSSVLKHVSSLFTSLEFFSFMYMPAHIDAVKNCCRNILSALTLIYDRLDEEQFPFTDGNAKQRTWVTSLLSTLLEKQSHIKWIALACVVRNTKKSLTLLDLDPMLPEDLLTTERALKSAANDTYVGLMSYHFERTSSEEHWEKIWIDPLFRAQPFQNNESNWPQKRSIISTILNSEKLRVAPFQKMILPLLKSVVKRMNKSQSSLSSSSSVLHQEYKMVENGNNVNFAETSLLAAETIKMAYELKITVDPKELNLESVRDSNSAPEDSFRGLVPRSVLNNWLWNENPQIRLAGFALLVETKKTSDLISRQDFESMKIFLKYNLQSQSPAYRQQFFSYFKKFVKRLKDGESCANRNRDREAVQNYQEFLRWLWHFFTEDEGLFVGANFARRCLALECMSELTQTFPNGFELFGFAKTGNTKYLRWLTDSYLNNKIEALEILSRMPMEEFNDDTFCSNLFNEAKALCKSIKPPDSVTGRYLMTLLMRKSLNEKYSPMNILESLYSELETILEQARSTSLIQVSSESPFYGCVRCIRMILENETNKSRQENDYLQYRSYIEKLLKVCFTIDKILFPVLGSAAPEGFLPELKDSAPEENKQVVRSLAAQMLLVCAWRSMKEICLLMSDMCCWFVLEGETNLPSSKRKFSPTNPTNYLMTYNQVSAIGDHLLYLMKNLMHRGVFEQVFVGFKQLATRLWKSTAPKLSSLPEKWLQDAMDQEHISAKSITRRSGGLPFIFQALLTAESYNETFLQKWVQRLLVFDESPEMGPIRIHSMNVLRGLFRDASFSSAMMPFVPHGLKMAFTGLKSPDWTERNSGLMLYGAVMRRTFGAKLNLMNAPTFFRKFPQMYDFLLNELDTCIQLMEQVIIRKKEDSAVPSDGAVLTCDFTFHLLLLLSSFTSSGRVEDTHFKLSEFIPRIKRCGESDDMEVRKLSARALLPFLVSPEDKLELAKVVLNEIGTENHMSQNQLHGLLVQFLAIIQELNSENSIEAVSNIVGGFLSAIILKIPNLTAPTTFEAAMEILEKLTALKSVQESELYIKALQTLENSFEKRFGHYTAQRNVIPGLLVTDKIIANCYIKILVHNMGMDSVLEKVYGYFTDPCLKSKPFIDQFLELMQEEDSAISPKFIHHLFSKPETSPETVVIIEAIIGNYLQRVVTEFSKFPGTEVELYYFKFMERIPVNVFENLEIKMVQNLVERLFLLCNDEDEVTTTLQIKAAALLILAKVVFSTGIDISAETKTKLCEMVLQWSTSDVDEDMRFAVAKSFPSIPFSNMSNFSVTNQAKLWSSILMLAQDDESLLRQILCRKLQTDDTCNSNNCDRKFLEQLVHLYVREFLIQNPIEGLLVIIGLLLREDFEVEAKAADDETEDRIFDKSEMNMYFEHQIFAKTIKTAIMESYKGLESHPFRFSLDVELLESQINLFNILANKNAVSCNSLRNSLSIRNILQESIISDNNGFVSATGADTSVYELGELTRNSSIEIKNVICKFLHDFFIDK